MTLEGSALAWHGELGGSPAFGGDDVTRSAGAAVALPAAFYPEDVEIDEIVRELAATTPCAVMTSCYLNLDRAQRPHSADHLRAFEALAERAERRANALGPSQGKVVERDLAAIREWLMRRRDTPETSGVACFACSARGLLRVVPLPVAVPDRIKVAAPPHLFPLELVAEEAPRFAVVLADAEEFRIIEARLGALRPYPSIIDGPRTLLDQRHPRTERSVTRAAEAKGLRNGSAVERHERVALDRHVSRCTGALIEHLRQHRVDLLIIGGSEVMQAHLERALPAPLRKMVAARVTMSVRAPLPQIRRMVDRVAAEIARRKDDDTLAELEFQVDAGRAVMGLTGVLTALDEARVGTLVVEVDPPCLPGAICLACQRITLPAPTCPACGSVTEPLDDVMEAAMERALGTGARVRVLRSGRTIGNEAGIAALPRDRR